MWEFSIPYPTWTGACLGMIALLLLEIAVMLIVYWKREGDDAEDTG